jgi:hypothetical protein
MTLKKVAEAISILLLLVAALLLPALFKVKSPPPLAGPEMSSLDYMEVQFRNGDLDLAGMLFIPDGAGPFPT